MLGNVAGQIGYGPRLTATRLRSHYQTGFKSILARRKRTERDRNHRMGKYPR